MIHRFNYWTVLSTFTSKNRYWLCRCECGKESEVFGPSVAFGKSRSCGCTNLEVPASTTHGRTKTREWEAWTRIRARCENPRNPGFARYGGRGIRVHESWQDFATFFADMGPKPSPEHSIDRIDNDGHYEPGNCRWATPTEQANNRSTSTFVEHLGERMTIAAWARKLGMAPERISSRLQAGMSPSKALFAGNLKTGRAA